MTKLATMGTSSCATLAIQGFTEKATFPNYQKNEAYLNEGKGNEERMTTTVGRFLSDVLWPFEQDLGRTDNYAFDELMDKLEHHGVHKKFIIATLNEHQTHFKDGYWPKRLEARGFSLIDKTNNDDGMICYIYTRNEARVDL